MADYNDELLCRIAFSNARGIHASTARQLIERIGNVSQFFALSQAQLHNLTGRNSEIFDDAYRHQLLECAQGEADFVRRNHIDALFIDEGKYPQRLRNCDDAPVLLYSLGSCNLDSAHMVAIVGTRHATPYGVSFTEALVRDLAGSIDNLVIVSGLAYGIDVASHRAALAAGVPTVGVMAKGLQSIYPPEHRPVAAKMVSTGGALVTEYCTTAPVHRSNFLARNRIIAGLCDCVVVVESDYKGGSMSTAHMAMMYNREVLAVPGRINDKYSHGTNRLIANLTATLITSADDLVEHMGWTGRRDTEPEAPTLFRALNADEQRIVDYVTANPNLTINDICVQLGMSYACVSDILMQLEMDDIILMLPGGRIAVAI